MTDNDVGNADFAGAKICPELFQLSYEGKIWGGARDSNPLSFALNASDQHDVNSANFAKALVIITAQLSQHPICFKKSSRAFTVTGL